jgi:hypothetical protein
MVDTIAAPPGWYYCRVKEGDAHLQRYPIAAWQVSAGLPALPLLAKPGEPGLVPPSAEDRAALVGLCPPDRDYQAYFSSDDVQEAMRRLWKYFHPREAKEVYEASVREVEMPGVGQVPVRDARPPGQQPSEWARRAWGTGSQETPRLGGSGG